MNRDLIGAVLAAMSLSLFGCQRADVSNRASAEALQAANRVQEEFVVFNDKTLIKTITASGSPCSPSICVFQALPEAAPLKRVTGEPLCKVPQYESQAVINAFFSNEDVFEGADCEISSSDYEEISARYGRENVLRAYLNQRVYEDFRTWRTKQGFVTTYVEVQGRAPDGGILRTYRLFAGPVERRHYSEFVSR